MFPSLKEGIILWHIFHSWFLWTHRYACMPFTEQNGKVQKFAFYHFSTRPRTHCSQSYASCVPTITSISSLFPIASACGSLASWCLSHPTMYGMPRSSSTWSHPLEVENLTHFWNALQKFIYYLAYLMFKSICWFFFCETQSIFMQW